jgi:uncharacterized membrane protein
VSKKTTMLIIGSLLLNVLLVGAIIGNISHRIDGKRFMRRHGREFAVKLPPDKQELFFTTMERVNRENRGIHRQMREARQRVLLILTAPEFDEAAYQREVEKLDQLRNRMMRRLEDATRELAKQFDQEERKALADHLRNPLPTPEQEPPRRKGPAQWRGQD